MVNPPQMTARLSSSVKLLLDFAPLLVFFVAFKLSGVMVATVALMVSTLLAMGFIYAIERRLAIAPLISGLLVTIFGGLAIVLQDDQFIKMKPTYINLVFAATLLGGAIIWKRGLLKYVLDVALSLTDEGWLVLSRRWGVFFLFLAGLNEIIWRNFSTEFWVNFKVFGMFSLTIVFALTQILLIDKYKLPEESADQ